VVASSDLLRKLFNKAISRTQPKVCMPPHMPERPPGRVVVVGAGKAAAAMAQVTEAHFGPDVEGLVVTRYGYGLPTKLIEVVEAGHPLPDAAGEKAASRMMAMVSELGEDDLVCCLLSGGGSALLALPLPGLSMEDKRKTTSLLLDCGATISEINLIRKQLSAIKGGRLAAAADPARVVTLMISDVPGDDPAVIASGPTVGHPPIGTEVKEILSKYRISLPRSVSRHFQLNENRPIAPEDNRLSRASHVIIANADQALEAAAVFAQAAGYQPLILGGGIEGESRAVALEHAEIALSVVGRGKKIAILSGGETTVTVSGTGRGGPNTEYMLSLCLALNGNAYIAALACDTDGIDGSEDNAGAVISPKSLSQMQYAGIDPNACLANNDSYGAFEAVGGLINTGPTYTNVNDFRAILIG